MVAKAIKRYVMFKKQTAFVVEHDFIMATYLADSIIVFEGQPGQKCLANKPQSLHRGMNHFLKILEVTFRRDKNNLRPRINKPDSRLDQEQKRTGNLFFTD